MSAMETGQGITNHYQLKIFQHLINKGVSWKIHQIQFQNSIQLNTGKKYRTVINTGGNTCIVYTNTGLHLKYRFLHHTVMGSQHANSKLALFHIYQPLLPTWRFFPQLMKIFDLFINFILFLTQKYYFISY